MSDNKPKNIREYIKWLKEAHNIEIIDRNKTYYDSVSKKVLFDFQKSDFWDSLEKQLNSINQEYYLQKGFYLFVSPELPQLKVKPYDSFLFKTFRKNIINNHNWPNAPESGWFLPTNWYSKINDIVRTFFVVKYLDGVSFLTDKLTDLFVQHGIPCKADLEAKEEGYYAAHVYGNFNFNIPKENWDTEATDISIEIQITTQLQEVLKKLLHRYYEEHRKKLHPAEIKWQWNYKSDEFSTNYLGHILHYVEGMIMEIREKQSESEK